MRTEPTNAEKIRKLPWVIAGEGLAAVFCQFTVFGSAFMLFLGELGLPKGKIGFLLSLIPLFGVLALFVAPLTERFGQKRSFVTFYAARKLIIAGLVLLPWAHAHWGKEGAFAYLVILLGGFSLCRAIAETAYWPWARTIAPDAIRGKFLAVTSNVALVANGLAMVVAAWVVGRGHGEERFLALFAVGAVAGLLGVVCYTFVPGGARAQHNLPPAKFFREAFSALRSREFRLFGTAVTVACFAHSPLAFAPLYLKEIIGFKDSVVILLPIAYLVGAMASSYLWGWSSDRYGAKPVMLFGLAGMLVPPVYWYLLPHQGAWRVPLALGGYFISGLAMMAWIVASNRCLMVNIIPRDRRAPFLSLYYGWISVAAGCGPLLAGWVIEWSRGLPDRWLVFHVDAYTVVFAMSVVLGALCVALMSRLPLRGEMGAASFLGMFLRGNPLYAFQSIIRHTASGGERKRIETTRGLGDARSPLGVEELVDALGDPSFNVRFEAVVSIARTRPHPKLVDALTETMAGDDADLRIAAAWALGRMGSADAVPALREAFASDYPLLRARSARALAMLGDTTIIPRLRELFDEEADVGLRLAYASALGGLGDAEAMEAGFPFLLELEAERPRMEMALAFARTVGHERRFVRLWRQTRREPGTALAQEVTRLRRGALRLRPAPAPKRTAMLAASADAFGHEDLAEGARCFAEAVPPDWVEGRRAAASRLLSECVTRLRQFGGERLEYVLLALHAFESKLEALARRGGWEE